MAQFSYDTWEIIGGSRWLEPKYLNEVIQKERVLIPAAEEIAAMLWVPHNLGHEGWLFSSEDRQSNIKLDSFWYTVWAFTFLSFHFAFVES